MTRKMFGKAHFLAVAIALCVALEVPSAECVTLVKEDFNDRVIVAPLSIYFASGTIAFNSANDIAGKGYSLQMDHSVSMEGVGILSGMSNYLANGIYFRYWVKYPSNYLFPGDENLFENVKMFKVAGANGWDVEFIYKNTLGGPSRLQLYWLDKAGNVSGTGTGNVSVGRTMAKDVWHKIEIYLKIAEISQVHVQIDDYDVYNNANANIRLPVSAYTGTNQFSSLRASNKAPSGRGTWYLDNVTVVYNEGDLTANEPPDMMSNISPPKSLRTIGN